jgi:hypothetical protein
MNAKQIQTIAAVDQYKAKLRDSRESLMQEIAQHTMKTELASPKVDAIRERLSFPTCDLGIVEHEAVYQLLQDKVTQLTCEDWGRKLGWDIPTYGTPEWQILHTAWLESE